MGIQEILDELSKGERAKRGLDQLTLGKLIEVLSKYPGGKLVVNINNPHSYRGYYSDLAFEVVPGYRTVTSLLNQLGGECLGATYTGYKGGEFYMDKHTPLWIANYSKTGKKMISIIDGDVLGIEAIEDK